MLFRSKILVVGHSFTFDAKRWFFSIEHSIEGDFYPVRDCQRERRKQLEYIEGRGSIGKGRPTTGGHGGAGHAGNVDTVMANMLTAARSTRITTRKPDRRNEPSSAGAT